MQTQLTPQRPVECLAVDMLLWSYFPRNSTKVNWAFWPCDAGGSEDGDLVSANHIQVIIQGQQHQEGEEQGCRREEVPDVVIIKEVQQHTLSVLLPGFCWGSLQEGDADVGKVPRFNPFRVLF